MYSYMPYKRQTSMIQTSTFLDFASSSEDMAVITIQYGDKRTPYRKNVYSYEAHKRPNAQVDFDDSYVNPLA